MVAPQSRLSLELKHHELSSAEGQGAARAVLDELRQLPYVDLLDEVDEVLHHRRGASGRVWSGLVCLGLCVRNILCMNDETTI